MTPTKLNKDQIQKIVLSGVGLIALVYIYLNFFLAPLAKSRTAMEHSIADLQAKIQSSKSEIPKANNLERQASTATARYAQLKDLTPEGAPIAWFPPRMKLFFANAQIEKSSLKMDSSSPFPQKELADWVHYIWQIDLPQTDYATAGKAIAELENSEPLLYITHLSIHAGNENPELQQVVLAASTTFFKR